MKILVNIKILVKIKMLVKMKILFISRTFGQKYKFPKDVNIGANKERKNPTTRGRVHPG